MWVVSTIIAILCFAGLLRERLAKATCVVVMPAEDFWQLVLKLARPRQAASPQTDKIVTVRGAGSECIGSRRFRSLVDAGDSWPGLVFFIS